MKKKIIVSDYGWLDLPIEKSWIFKTKLDFHILDKKHRIKLDKNISHQKNVGQNIYDIFDYIYKNYDDLEDILICRGCIMFPKNRKDLYLMAIALKIFGSLKIIHLQNYTMKLNTKMAFFISRITTNSMKLIPLGI